MGKIVMLDTSTELDRALAQKKITYEEWRDLKCLEVELQVRQELDDDEYLRRKVVEPEADKNSRLERLKLSKKLFVKQYLRQYLDKIGQYDQIDHAAYIANQSVGLNLDGRQHASKRLNVENHPFSHEHLWSIVPHKPTDFEPYGYRKRHGPDCSSGCKWYLELPGRLGMDWGVCVNPVSPRCGLLTFEHMGCPFFEYDEEGGEDDRSFEERVNEIRDHDLRKKIGKKSVKNSKKPKKIVRRKKGAKIAD